MSKLQDTSFTSYSFTDQEVVVAGTFTELQLQYLLTERSIRAETKLRIAYNPSSPEQFAFEHEYLRGAIEVLDFILARHDDLQEQGRELLRQQTENQQSSS